MCSSIQSSLEHYTTSNSIIQLDYMQRSKKQTSNFTSYSFSNSLWQQFTSDSMENLTSENENKMTNIVEISEEDVHGVRSLTPPTGDNEKNPNPIKQLKPQKTGVDVKRHKKLKLKVWNDFEVLDTDENGELHCKCKKCGQVYNAETRMGTGNLKRHLRSCKPSRFKDIGQMVLDIGSCYGAKSLLDVMF
ncbi:unnamed protein product [Lactuca saligna]|uniref:BED-type domain-containing protein n=1 Tax=Lactuca saligna TaxID=75948 RepID=A0AA36E6U2_LACSI|nr:unnamed protein product [Lactuca saligna]